jgi:endonuclease YncB( thermonuclease family)
VLHGLGLRRRLVFLILAIMVVQLVAEITPPDVSTPPLSALRFIGPGGADAAGPGSADVRGFVRVIDGDTMDVIIRGHRVAVGLLGVQAPMGNTDCGRAATAALQALVRGGIHLDDDASITFDSRLRRMYQGVALDGKPIGEQLARAGLVVGDGRGQHGSDVLAAEVEARSAGRGCAWQGLPAPKPGAGGRFSRPASDLEMFARNIGNALAPLANARLLGPSPAAAAPNPAISLPPGFTTDLIVGGLVNPTAFTFLQDGRILVALKNGVVRVIKNGALLPTPFIDIRDHVNDYFDRGLLGIAVSPTFSTDGYVYLMYTFEDNASQYPASKAGRLTRVTAVGDTASPSTEFTLLGTVVGGSCESHPAGSDCIRTTSCRTRRATSSSQPTDRSS